MAITKQTFTLVLLLNLNGFAANFGWQDPVFVGQLNGIPPSGGGTPPSSLVTNLTAYWKMDNATGNFTDSGPDGVTLTNMNTVVSIDGRVGNAGDFNSALSQYCFINDTTNLSLANSDYTICLWFYPSNVTGNQVLVGKRSGTFVNEYLIRQEVTLLRYYVGNGVDTQSFVTTNVTITTNVWHFLAIWHDAANATMGLQYDNGQVNTTTSATTPVDTATSFFLGRREDGIQYFTGRLDEIGIWRRILTSDERNALYNSGNGKTHPF